MIFFVINIYFRALKRDIKYNVLIYFVINIII